LLHPFFDERFSMMIFERATTSYTALENATLMMNPERS